MMVPSFSLLLILQRPTRPLQPRQPALRFWCLTPKGRGFEYVSLRGSDISRGSLVIILAYLLHLEFLYVRYTIMHLCVWYIMHSCLLLYLCDSDIYVIMIYDMCALYFEFFICHITCALLICFCFRTLLRCKWALLLVLMLISYLLSTSCWLGSYKLA